VVHSRDRNVAENLAWLRRFTLGLLKQHPSQKHNLVMKRRMAGWNPAFLAKILFGATTECVLSLDRVPTRSLFITGDYQPVLWLLR
jgi:hypothetical protein